MTHKTVVRNKAFPAASAGTVERHNERKNEEYFNGDIQKERADLNVHFCRHFHPDGSPETYQETFERLLEERKIVKHGTKPDAKLYCEMIFDVNTAYFEENGGYEYAKKYFEEAYRLAIKEAGGEDYILSAVMHADERNKALSEQMRRDVYHYHLHVVYVPVVQKNLYFRKDHKDPEKAGKLKEVIPQISQSNKWPLRVPIERNGKTYTVNSYSLLQDRYHEHMRAMGFDGIERGERGSTAEHLDVLDFKIKQDTARSAALDTEIEHKEQAAAELDTQAQQKKTEVDYLVKATAVRSNISATQKEIDAMAKPGKSGKNQFVSNEDWSRVSTMAKRCILLDQKAKDMQSQIDNLRTDRDTWKANYERLWGEVKDFIRAIRSMPDRLRAFIQEHGRSRTQKQEVSR